MVESNRPRSQMDLVVSFYCFLLCDLGQMLGPLLSLKFLIWKLGIITLLIVGTMRVDLHGMCAMCRTMHTGKLSMKRSYYYEAYRP